MTTTALRRAGSVLAVLAVLVLGQLVGAGPAVAHAELVTTDPVNGAQLAEPPPDVELVFTESVGLLEDGIRLLDAEGDTVPTSDPVADGSTVRWAMPSDLPDGAYVVNWRVLSGDSHPVAGAFSFGVGDGVTVTPMVAEEGQTLDAPWQVIATKFVGYFGFTLIAGTVVFAVYCWQPARRHSRIHRLFRVGLTAAAIAAVLAMLLQGPYVSAQPLTNLFDRALLSETGHSDFAAWTQIRLFILIAMAAILWPRDAFENKLNRWFAGAGVLGVAVTFSGTAHAAASGSFIERAVDSTHVLGAGIWVGGLIALAVATTGRGERPDTPAVQSFSRVALLSVLVLVATGTVNSLYRLDTPDSLWRSDYGRLLALKIGVVAAAVGVAAASRRRLSHGADRVQGTVRVEVVTTLLVLALTAVLATVSPPSTQPTDAASTATGPVTVDLDLDAGASAHVEVDPATVDGSRLTVTLLNADGAPLDARKVQLTATLPAQDIGAIDIALTATGADHWEGEFTFPYAGEWTLTLTAENAQQAAVVTSGTLDVE
ncbi:MAG: copper resistance protein CopC [Nocardioides sp.]|jgi:copper transport protein|uniref:copper resistance CopC/CopD family protein n=1 Tax=Nocardioides sp. TaxID=35761 RepID=UPI0026376120|nr:FixH family protein [Nocardioides sp.]MCW2832651.1 copper resistance protein CopC [Nocardioides sp.]